MTTRDAQRTIAVLAHAIYNSRLPSTAESHSYSGQFDQYGSIDFRQDGSKRIFGTGDGSIIKVDYNGEGRIEVRFSGSSVLSARDQDYTEYNSIRVSGSQVTVDTHVFTVS